MVVGPVRAGLSLAFGVAVAACGESPRGLEPSPARASGGSAGVAGTGAAGLGAHAGSGGLDGSSGGVGGARAGTGGVAGAAIDPEVTRRYTWQVCGRIQGAYDAFSISSLDIDASGTLLVSNYGIATAWHVGEPFDTSEALWSSGGEGAYNTDVSADGSMVILSGDLRLAFDAWSGELLPLTSGPVPDGPVCILTEYRFSPDGRFVAGKHYGPQVEVLETTGFTRVALLETRGCWQGLAFFSDAIVTPEGAFSTSNWAATTLSTPLLSTSDLGPGCYVYLDPDRARPTICCAGSCKTSLGDGWTLLGGGQHPRFSSEGHWLVSAGTLLHLPSGETRVFDRVATEALFAPNGDVIAGEEDGSIVRFCRSE